MEDNLQHQECINPGRPVYFSYARNSNRKAGWEHISDCVEKILATFRERGIEYRVDVKDIGAGDSISDFEREIGWDSEVVVLVFSDKYFRSLHCLYEFVQIKNAFKKHPEKRLICIKSGDINLADTNYIMELAHNMGDIKQEYDTIEYHHLRSHSGTEIAAYSNGFYIDDIRDLNSFFGGMKCYDANSDDWDELADEVEDYYTNASKSFLLKFKEKRAIIAKVASASIGLVLVAAAVWFCYTVYDNLSVYHTVEYPEYTENNLLQEDEVSTNITKITSDDNYITLHFHSVNLTDDTLRKVVVDTADACIVVSGYEFDLVEVSGGFNRGLPEYYPGGKGSFVDYVMKFQKMILAQFDFVQGDGRGVFGIKVRKNQSYQTKSPLRTKVKQVGSSITIEHPSVSDGYEDFQVAKIELTDEATVVFAHFVDLFGEDTYTSIPRNCHIVANDTSYKVRNLNGITFEPFVTPFPSNTALDCALFFPPIDFMTDSIDLVFDDSTAITGIKLHRDTIATVEKPFASGQRLGNAIITKVEVNKNETVLHFRHANTFKNKILYVSANSDSYILAGGQKYPLEDYSGISEDTIKTLIPVGTALEYALFFPPIPPDTEVIDFIDSEYSREDLGDKQFNKMLDIFGDEYADDSRNTISTGIFGIRLKFRGKFIHRNPRLRKK